MACYTCSTLSSIEASALITAQSVFMTAAPSLSRVMYAVAGLLFLWRIARYAVAGESPHGGAITVVVSTTVSAFLLASYSTYAAYIFEPARDYTAWFSGRILASSGFTGGGGASFSIMEQAERVSLTAINIAWAMYKDASWYRIDLMIAACILIIPFFATLVGFLGILVYSTLITDIPVVTGPLLILAGTFAATRKIMFAGLDYFITAAATTIIATFWMAVSTTALSQATAGLPGGFSPWAAPTPGGAIPTTIAADYAGSMNFWITCVMAWLNLLFLALTPSLAGYFTGKVDSANLAGAAGTKAVSAAHNAMTTAAAFKTLFGKGKK